MGPTVKPLAPSDRSSVIWADQAIASDSVWPHDERAVGSVRSVLTIILADAVPEP
jgi:hypothetical protein